MNQQGLGFKFRSIFRISLLLPFIALSACNGPSSASDALNSKNTDGNAATAQPASTPAPSAFVVTGQNNSCAILEDGTYKCWGLDTNYPSLYSQSSAVALTSPGPGVAGVANGTYFNLFLKGGQVYGSGTSSGVIPAGLTTTSPIAGVSDVQAIGAGELVGCFIKLGRVYCFGIPNDSSHALGGSSITVPVPGVEGATQVTGGRGHMCALVAAGKVYCWGADGNGQVDGNPPGAWWEGVPPTEVPHIIGASAITAGEAFTCALIAGQVRCWGDNSYGQTLGSDFTTPIAGLSGVSQIVAGGSHVCALVAGQVYCWGQDNYGQVTGVNGGTPVSTPTVVAGLANVTYLTSRGDSTCAMTAHGASVSCWGRNFYGQTGNADTSNTTLTRVLNVP